MYNILHLYELVYHINLNFDFWIVSIINDISINREFDPYNLEKFII